MSKLNKRTNQNAGGYVAQWQRICLRNRRLRVRSPSWPAIFVLDCPELTKYLIDVDASLLTGWLRGAMAAHLSSKQKVAGSIPVVACLTFYLLVSEEDPSRLMKYFTFDLIPFI
jgi:hypothetical protein